MNTDKPAPNDAEYITPREAAQLLRVSVGAVLRAVNSGRLPCVRLTPRTFRIPARAIDELLRSADLERITAGTEPDEGRTS